jgi:hypothetical integral membrane protein (TIGR02206 family)
MDWGQFFSYADWKGPAFELFGPAHLTAITLFVLLNTGFIVFRKRVGPNLDRFFRYSMATLLIVDEILWHVWNAVNGQWTLQTMLPLYICSICVWVGAYMLVTKNYTIFEFVFLLGIPSALQAFLTPDAGPFGFPHFRFFQVMLSHGLIISSAVYMAAVIGYKPTWASVKKVLIYSNIYAVLVFFLNFLIGSNYLFLAHKLATKSLLDALPPWPYYLAIVELLGIVFVLLFYAPYGVSDWLSRRRSKSTN